MPSIPQVTGRADGCPDSDWYRKDKDSGFFKGMTGPGVSLSKTNAKGAVKNKARLLGWMARVYWSSALGAKFGEDGLLHALTKKQAKKLERVSNGEKWVTGLGSVDEAAVWTHIGACINQQLDFFKDTQSPAKEGPKKWGAREDFR
jgi:hypothetical protein